MMYKIIYKGATMAMTNIIRIYNYNSVKKED